MIDQLVEQLVTQLVNQFEIFCVLDYFFLLSHEGSRFTSPGAPSHPHLTSASAPAPVPIPVYPLPSSFIIQQGTSTNSAGDNNDNDNVPESSNYSQYIQYDNYNSLTMFFNSQATVACNRCQLSLVTLLSTFRGAVCHSSGLRD